MKSLFKRKQLKQKWYKAYIMERFMTKKEQREFQRKYDEAKIVSIGRKALGNGRK